MFNLSLFRKEMLALRLRLIVGTIVLIGMVIFTHFLYPYLSALQDMIPPSVPFVPDLQQQMKLISESYGIYAWSQWQPKNLTQTGTILAILYGMGMIAGEKQAGTLNFLLSRPLNRREIYLTKSAAGVLSLFITTAVPTVLLLVLGITQTSAFPIMRFIGAYFLVFCGLLLIYLLTQLISVIMNEPVAAAAVSIGVVAVLSAVGWVPATKKFGLFNVMHGANYYLRGEFPWGPLMVVLMICVFLVWGGAVLFRHRENQ